MATPSPADLPIQPIRADAPVPARPMSRPRRISPEAGRALELLGHAIEYLTDEFVRDGEHFEAENPRIQAVQLLMSLNRQIYLACPQVPTLGERLRGVFKGSSKE